MDLFNILIWVTLVLTGLALGFHYYFRKESREQMTISALLDFAKENNCIISSYDHWDKTLIGIDNKEINKLFFIRTTPNKDYREFINLSEVTSCRLVKSERTAGYKEEKVNLIDKIEIVFSFIYTQKPEVTLEFYNTDYDQLTLSGELQLAQKWTGMIQSIVNTNREWKDKEKEKELVDPIIVKQVSKSKFAKNRKEKRPVEKKFAF